MTFTFLDVVLIAVLLVFIITGFILGLIQGIGALVGVFAGAWLAGRYFMVWGDWLAPFFFGQVVAAKIIAFVLIFILVNRLVGFLFYLINRVFRLISIIPFLKSINRLGGLILGLIEGVLVLGLIIYVMAKFASDIEWLAIALGNSMVARWLVSLASIAIQFLPEALAKMQSIF